MVPVMSMTTGWPGWDGGAVTVTRMGAESSPFSFSARTLNSPQCHLLAAPILRLVWLSVVSTWTSSLGQIGSSSKNLRMEKLLEVFQC